MGLGYPLLRFGHTVRVVRIVIGRRYANDGHDAPLQLDAARSSIGGQTVVRHRIRQPTGDGYFGPQQLQQSAGHLPVVYRRLPSGGHRQSGCRLDDYANFFRFVKFQWIRVIYPSNALLHPI